MARKKVKENDFYNLKNILEKDAVYSIIIGERSNGKTYAVLKHMLEQYFKNGSQFGIIRRWEEDIKPMRANTFFAPHTENKVIYDLSNGEFWGVAYRAGEFRLTLPPDENGKCRMSDNVIGYGFALSTWEHGKMTSFPNIKTVLFDEFLTRSYYLPDEFVIFSNVLSTIIRQRDDVKIFMCGNTVNKYCPYFEEMGLTNVKRMKKGTIDVYRYGNNEKLTVAVEYSDFPAKKKPSDFYFAFDNPRLKMITSGEWEIGIYPHLPVKYNEYTDVLFRYFIIFGEDILQCNVILVNDQMFTYIHRKTTDIRNIDSDLVFSEAYSPRPNWRRRINNPTDELGRKIWSMFTNDRVFYQSNTIGEIVRNYLMWCKTDSLK